MKKTSIFLLLPIILFLLAGCSNNENNNEALGQGNQSNTQNSVAKRITVPLDTNNSTNNIANTANITNSTIDTQPADPNRNNNIRLTCSVLNEHIVAPGETFSFTDLVGKSTYDKGYKQANVISNDGETIKGLGGGNCQVSSTLYNAVAAVPELEVIERHNHGAEVYYVPIGQDAAVAHGSIDFKFKNNLSSNIKIYASSDDKTVTTSISKVK